MAQGFLQSFDANLSVFSAGTEPAAKVNPKAVFTMAEAGVDISRNTPRRVDQYLDDEWDYVITVCDHANETCPAFFGKVKHRLHIGFEDPSNASGTEDYIMNEFRRIRNLIKEAFYKLYSEQIKPNMS
jgi:arsenate reductase